MTTGPVALVESAPTAAAVVRGHVTPAELPGFLSAAYTDVLQVLAEQHRVPAGPPFARYRESGDGFEVEAGFPSDGPPEPSGRVVPLVLPGGPAVTALHHGSYESVGETYDALTRWLTAHGHRPAGDAWESYLDEPGVPQPRTAVHLPCTRDPGAPVGRRRWRDLSPAQQTAVLVLASVQLSLAATAWADLATRPPERVNGRKSVWAAAIAVNFVGPVAWFRWGRRS